MSGPDLLANKLLEHGYSHGRSGARGRASAGANTADSQRPSWNTFVGTKECFDTMAGFFRAATRGLIIRRSIFQSCEKRLRKVRSSKDSKRRVPRAQAF